MRHGRRRFYSPFFEGPFAAGVAAGTLDGASQARQARGKVLVSRSLRDWRDRWKTIGERRLPMPLAWAQK
jgi:hypothetical protein